MANSQLNGMTDPSLMCAHHPVADGVKWTVVRREKDVLELHAALKQLMHFVPDAPVEKRWRWRGAINLGMLAKRLQDYLTELTVNGQWIWDESAVLRQFLQIPVAPVKQ